MFFFGGECGTCVVAYDLAVSGAGGDDTGLSRRGSIGSSVGLGIWWAGHMVGWQGRWWL